MKTTVYIFDKLVILILLLAFQEICKAQQISESDNNNPPNIIFILTDDQRFDALGYAGNDLISTPQMDKLAEEGTYFPNALVTTPICAASRASILTGLYERTHRFDFQSGNIREEYMANSYPVILKNNGYQTGFFGKYGVRYDALDKQFDVYESYDRNNAYDDRRGYYYKTLSQDTVHLTRYTGQKALDFIDSADAGEPFALSLSFSAPHAHDSAEDQYFWQEESDNLLQNTTMPGPELGDDQYFEAQPKIVREGFNRTRWYWRFDTPEKYQHSVKGYYRMISGVDREIAKIRERLAEKGLADNTVIMLMGDNGYFLGERQLAGKWLMYDNSIRVPLILFDPRSDNQSDSEEMATNVDIPSTMLDLAGIPQPQSWQGKSLMPVVSGQAKSLERDTVLIEHLWEFENIPPSEGVRTSEWKYFRYVNDKSIEELYNLKEDPQEINNLAADPDHASVLESLRRKTDELVKRNSDAYSAGPKNLAVELIREPEGVSVLDKKPEYSWVVPDSAVYQSAYQILVASSKENINNNIGDVWDSGQVRSSESTGIEHGGEAPAGGEAVSSSSTGAEQKSKEQLMSLQNGKTYYWKVRIWDESNRLTEYSESQAFTTGDSDAGANADIITTGNTFQVDSLKPDVFEKQSEAHFIDFGKDAFATMTFSYDAAENDTLTVRIGEQLNGDAINREPGGHIRYQEMEVPVTPGKTQYRLPIEPDERNTSGNAIALPDSFPVLMPFRYAEVEGVQATLSGDDFTQLAYHGYWEDEASSFESSDEILNQVWELCKYSIKATTFAGLYVDGDRERIPYEADAYLNQLSHYTTDREYAIARQTIEYFMENPTWPTEWQQHMALMFYADYMYTGNTELIEKYYEDLKHKTLYELSREDGLISSENATPAFMKKLGFEDPEAELRDITDWPPAGWQGNEDVTGERDGFVFKPYNTVINSFFYKNMKIMAEFARVLGKSAEATEFELRAVKVKKAINLKLFDEETGAYVDGEGTDHSSVHANMIPLAFGIVPDDRQQSVVDFIKLRGMAASVYGAQYLMESLYRAGEEDYALDLLTSKSDRSWYNMIRVGSTITMEAWDMKYKPNADWNHAWGAVPANIIPRELWGITPAEPGYKLARIEPQMGSLQSSNIEVPTIRGKITGEYEYVNDRRQTYAIEIPANMVAEFNLQTGSGKVLMLNGEKAPAGFDTLRLTPGSHQIAVVVNSF